jgi:hypothetical protein
MMSNSNNKATALIAPMLVTAAVALILTIEPAPGQSQTQVQAQMQPQGQGQGQSRRDRFRRDTSTSPASGRSTPGRPDSSNRPDFNRVDRNRRDNATARDTGRPGRITRPMEPNGGRFVDSGPVGPVEKDEQWDKYKIILARNMFSRDRVPVQEQRKSRPGPTVNPESYFLLRAVVQEDNRFLAFVEDKQSGSVLRLREGDHVARGQIKSLTLDSLEYQLQDKVTSINLGYDLEGGHGAVTASDIANFTPPTASSASPGATSTTPTAAPTAGEDEILKRLMEQRKQQMGQ